MNLKGFENVDTKKRNGYIAYYYRFQLNKKRKRIALGTPKEGLTRTQFKIRYNQAKNLEFNLRYGLDPQFTQAPVEEKPKELWLKDVFPKFVNAFCDSTKTWMRDLHNFGHFVRYFGKDNDWLKNEVSQDCKIDINAITSEDIDAFYQDQYKQHKTNTVNCRHKYLNPFYTWLERKEYITKNQYALKNKLKQQGSDSDVHQVLEMDQIQQIIKLTKNHDHKVLWTIMAWTGLAPVDASKLDKTKDIVSNGKFDCIMTARQKSIVVAKIPVLGGVAQLGDIAFTLDMNKTARDNANREFVKLAKKVGVKKKPGHILAQYCIRHSLSSFLRPYLSDNEIAMFLGHNNKKTQQTYTQQTVALQEKLADAFNQ